MCCLLQKIIHELISSVIAPLVLSVFQSIFLMNDYDCKSEEHNNEIMIDRTFSKIFLVIMLPGANYMFNHKADHKDNSDSWTATDNETKTVPFSDRSKQSVKCFLFVYVRNMFVWSKFYFFLLPKS